MGGAGLVGVGAEAADLGQVAVAEGLPLLDGPRIDSQLLGAGCGFLLERLHRAAKLRQHLPAVSVAFEFLGSCMPQHGVRER